MCLTKTPNFRFSASRSLGFTNKWRDLLMGLQLYRRLAKIQKKHILRATRTAVWLTHSFLLANPRNLYRSDYEKIPVFSSDFGRLTRYLMSLICDLDFPCKSRAVLWFRVSGAPKNKLQLVEVIGPQGVGDKLERTIWRRAPADRDSNCNT